MIIDKKVICFLLAIAAVLVFTFTLADCMSEIDHSKAPWLRRTDKDLITQLRMEINGLSYALSTMAINNRYLRGLIYTTKPDHWTTWIELLDECKRLEGIIKAKNERIRILEKQLGIRQWQTPAPYRKI